MGYHVIIDPELFPIRYTYVEQIEELLTVEGINERSIIFQGMPDNPPQQVGVSEDFLHLGAEWYLAGLRAQVIFAKLARARRLVLEELSQDVRKFKTYVEGIKKTVKRGDFLIRNLGNLEVEVKCRTFYGNGAKRYFLFSKNDLEKHLNMQEATHTPVVVAVFQRKKDKPLEHSLGMIKIDRLLELSKEVVCEKKDYGWMYQIPLKELQPGFDLLKDYGLQDQDDVVDLVEVEEKTYPETEDEPYVLVAYYKSPEHLEWILKTGLYNLRMGTDRGALHWSKKEMSARYILLHTEGEKYTGKLFRILSGPELYSKERLIVKKYPGIPGHSRYWVYKIVRILDNEFNEQLWDITSLSGYISGRGAALPFAVPLAELLK